MEGDVAWLPVGQPASPPRPPELRGRQPGRRPAAPPRRSLSLPLADESPPWRGALHAAHVGAVPPPHKQQLLLARLERQRQEQQEWCRAALALLHGGGCSQRVHAPAPPQPHPVDHAKRGPQAAAEAPHRRRRLAAASLPLAAPLRPARSAALASEQWHQPTTASLPPLQLHPRFLQPRDSGSSSSLDRSILHVRQEMALLQEQQVQRRLAQETEGQLQAWQAWQGDQQTARDPVRALREQQASLLLQQQQHMAWQARLAAYQSSAAAQPSQQGQLLPGWLGQPAGAGASALSFATHDHTDAAASARPVRCERCDASAAGPLGNLDLDLDLDLALGLEGLPELASPAGLGHAPPPAGGTAAPAASAGRAAGHVWRSWPPG